MSYGERRLQLDWFHWQDKRNPDSPCPSCPGGKKCSRFGKSLGEKKKEGERRRGRNPTRLVCPAFSRQFPSISKSASGTFIFAAMQSLLSSVLPIQVAPLLSQDDGVRCPQGLQWPQGRVRTGRVCRFERSDLARTSTACLNRHQDHAATSAKDCWARSATCSAD